MSYSSKELNELAGVVEKKMSDYVAEVGSVSERLKELEQSSAPGFKGGMHSMGGLNKTLGDVLGQDDAYKALRDRESRAAMIKIDSSMLGLDVKNTIIGESGSPQDPDGVLAQAQRLQGIVGGPFRSLSLLDFLPVAPASSSAVEYTREASWTNDSAETSEGATKPESDLTFELITDPVRTIAHWFRVSRQVLDDSAALGGYIDRRLRHGVRARLQRQIITGDGTSPNLAGITQTGRHTAFTPTTGDNALDSLNRAKYQIIEADFAPSFVLLNPADWGQIERLKSSTESYLAGEGSAVTFISGGMQSMVWGLPVVLSNDMTQGSFIMADAMALQVSLRQQATVEMFDQDASNVTENLLTVRGELRAAFSVFVPAAVMYGPLVV